MASRANGLIPTKLTQPSVPSGLVSRLRLHARLDAHTGRTILISAPAGCGKTALVVDWLEARGLDVAWLSVDRYDNDPIRFFNHLSASVAALAGPGAGRAASLLAALGQRSGPAPEVGDALAALGGDAVLVLDDIHELDEPRVLSRIEPLLGRADGPRLVLLTRVDPPLPMARLRVNGDLLELRERDLRFTIDECDSLFARLLPGGLSPALVRQLEQRTEGWAAGLRMAAIALHDTADRAAAVAAFAGSHRIVADYLVEEAIERQSDAVQRFLMDTSILERFTPATCIAVTEDADAATHLAAVEAASLFLVPLGHDRQWYRYHHLFRELLEFRLRRHWPDRVETLHRRASEWFEQAGDVNGALDHAARMTDGERLPELLDAHAFDIIARSELATLEQWVRRVRAPLSLPYPMLIIAIGWLRLLTERVPDLEQVLRTAESALARAGPDYDAARRQRAQVQLQVLRSFAARFAGRIEEALELSHAVLHDLPDGDAFTRGLMVFNVARLHMVLAEMEPAAQLLARSINDNLQAGNLYLVLVGLGQAATVRAQMDGVFRAREELNAAIAFAEQRHLTSLPAFSAVLYHLAHVELLADRLDEAEAAALRAVEIGRAGSFPEGHANGLLALVRIATARHRFEDAERHVTELAALAQDSNVVLLDTTVPLEQQRLALAREQARAGPPTAPLPTGGDERWTNVRELELILGLRQALCHGDDARAAALSSALLSEAEPRRRGVARCVALLGQALCPTEEDRWSLLDSALCSAAERGYVRPLLELGEPLRLLLQASLHHPLTASARALARSLLERFERSDQLERSERFERAIGPDPIAVGGALIEPLTAREEEVLGYLAAELSNKAIARAMFVSAETVKTHLKHVYWKLGAGSRREAVSRARELGLLRGRILPPK